LPGPVHDLPYTKAQAKHQGTGLIGKSVTAHGYSEIMAASFLHLHYSTITRILAANGIAKLKDFASKL
jgi:hypothetical protein